MRFVSSLFVLLAAGYFLVPALVYAQSETDLSPLGEDIGAADEELSAKASEKPKKPQGKFSVTPIVTNDRAKARDIIKKELTLHNHTEAKQNIYIEVENIDPTEGVQEFVSPGSAPLATSLANWIEVTRGVVELAPGESKTVPYLIHVNLAAEPGSYFARMRFGSGPSRASAMEGTGTPELLLNVEVQDDAREHLNLGRFLTENSVVTGSTAAFTYALENTGNREIIPRGSIRIFNRRGEEVGDIAINGENEQIGVGVSSQLAGVWDASGRFGRYKAFLDLEYGENQLATVQDTVYFWVLPWKEILLMLVSVVALGIMGTYIMHTRQMAQPVRVRASSVPSYENEAPQPTVRGTPAPFVSARSARTTGDTVTLGAREAPSAQTAVAPRQQTLQHGHVVQLKGRR